MWLWQVHQGCGSGAPRSDWPKGCDRNGGAEKERFCRHHTSVKGRDGGMEMEKMKNTKISDRVKYLLQDEDGKGLTDEEIQAEANTFMFAGELFPIPRADIY